MVKGLLPFHPDCILGIAPINCNSIAISDGLATQIQTIPVDPQRHPDVVFGKIGNAVHDQRAHLVVKLLSLPDRR